MNIHKDFEEFLQLLNDEKVEYVIVGGYAVAFHGYVRATQDIDLFYKNSEKNILRIQKALQRFGISTSSEQLIEFKDPGSIIRMGFPPVKIEMINSISGLSFNEVWENRISGHYGTIPVNFISYGHLLRNKRESGRPKDIADFDELGGNLNT
jgi:predicted nucleotidyltransferase